MKSFKLHLDHDNQIQFESLVEKQNAIEYSHGKKMSLVIKKEVSQIFRGYYFGGVIGFVHELGIYPGLAKMPIDYRKDGFSLVDAYHELLKRDFNGINIQTGNGIEKIGKSIAVDDSSKFTNYIERISAYTSENFSIPAPTPDEYAEYSNMKKEFSRFYIENQSLFGLNLHKS